MENDNLKKHEIKGHPFVMKSLEEIKQTIASSELADRLKVKGEQDGNKEV